MNPTLNVIDGHQISYAVAGACALFLFLLLLFELLRTRLYWIYEPRVHRDDYKSKTPPAPGRTPFAWVRCVFEHSREELVVGGSVAAPPRRSFSHGKQCPCTWRRGQRRQIHVLKLWLYALALVLFFGGWLAWKNDLNGAWCFRRGSALYWLQGHAVWHVLTMGALGCIY